MNDVFINYRTGDGDEAAAMLEGALSTRFGGEKIFRAAKSIAPGESYPEKLLSAVRQSAVLLAIMGPDWSSHPRLRDENDWVRREILEAYGCGIPVIPVLKGRTTDRLNAADLPADLARLADVQSLRLDTRDNGTDLRRIGDELAALVPSLKEADRPAHRSPDPGAVSNSASEIHGTVTQSRDITGDVGTVIKGNDGPIHAGKGDINQNSQHFSGDGATYVQGDNHGGISHRFGGSRRDDDER
jgi:hypothetical protein